MKYLGFFAIICWFVEITTAIRYPNWDNEPTKPDKPWDWGEPYGSKPSENFCSTKGFENVRPAKKAAKRS